MIVWNAEEPKARPPIRVRCLRSLRRALAMAALKAGLWLWPLVPERDED